MGDYYDLEEAYSMNRVLERYRYTNDAPQGHFKTTTQLITEQGVQYPFQHTHSSRLASRPLPRVMNDCPHPNARISAKNGECMDQCLTDKHCALGYSCNPDGYCEENGEKKIFCDDELQLTRNDLAISFGDNFNNFHKVNYGLDRCIQTSHNYLKGRNEIDISTDKRYTNLY